MRRAALCVFAKEPVAGRVKTRMTPPLSAGKAATFYAAMLDDVLTATADQANQLALAPRVCFDPESAADAFAARVPPSFHLSPQRGGDLGARMANAFAEMATAGFDCMLLRGSDSPGLELAIVAEALAALEASSDVVLTPDRDGGFALIGLKKPHNALFDLEYSTPSVLEETILRARSLGLSIALTAPTFDLDTLADLVWLDALAPERSSVLCPRTVEFVRAARAIGVL